MKIAAAGERERGEGTIRGEGGKGSTRILSLSSSSTSFTESSSSKYYYDNFLNSIKTEATKQLYIYGLNRYMQYHHFDSIDDLLFNNNNKEEVEEEEKEKEPNIRAIEANIIQYIVWLKQDQKLSSTSVELYLSAIMHFFSMNDIVLNRKKIGMYLGEYVRTQKDRAYTTEEIHRLLDFCDERSKALVLLLASTGIRIGSVTDLQLRHLKKITTVEATEAEKEKTKEKHHYQLYHIVIYEGTKEEYYCFTTPEAAAAIDTYLDYRKRYGEKLTDNSPLFREQFDINDLLAIKYPKKMKTRGLIKLLIRQLNRSGVIPAGKEIEGTIRGKKINPIARCHGFRKFATTNMIRAKMNPEAREMLLGHSISLTGAYYRPSDDEILSEYVKAVDLLTINEENRLKLQLQDEQSKQTELTTIKLQQNAMKDMLVNLVTTLQNSTSQDQINSLSHALAAAGILKPSTKKE
jgi:integrase